MISAIIRLLILKPIDWFLALLGLIIVPFVLPFTRIESKSKPFTQYEGTWWLERLPRFALPWDNPVDGCLGDTRGWWDNYCKEHYNTSCHSFYSKYQWIAIRNPSNYFSRITIGVDESRCKVELVKQWKYSKFVKATRDDGKIYFLYDGFIPYKNGTHGFEWRIGWKLDFDNPTKDLPIEDRYRGSVLRIRPWKAL